MKPGKIESTETTYKYHMQVTESADKKLAEILVPNERGDRKMSTVSVQSNISNLANMGEELHQEAISKMKGMQENTESVK